MKKSRILTMLAAVGMVSVLSFAGVANANPLYHGGAGGGLTQEQQSALQQIYTDYEKQAMPLQRQLQAKRAELDALYYSESSDSSKVQTLFREAGDIEAKLFALNSEMRKKLDANGLSGAGGNGYAHHGGERRGGHGGGGHW